MRLLHRVLAGSVCKQFFSSFGCAWGARALRIAGAMLLGWTATVPGSAQTANFSYAQVALGSAWQSPAATAVDGNGNLYVADAASNSVKEIAAVNGVLPASPIIQTLASSFS